MKLKSFILSFILIICAVVMVGCTNEPTSNLSSTDLGIYDLYYDYMYKTQTDIKNIDTSGFAQDDVLKASVVLNNVDNLIEEEVAIIASIECYNMTTTPKRININIDNGLISVRYENKVFICEISYENGTNKIYNFSISKESTTNKYTVSYTQYSNLQSKAFVIFNKEISYISIDLTSYDQEGEKYQNKKEFYLLANSNKVLNINVSIGSASNRIIYGVTFYKEVFNYNAKISSCNNFSAALDSTQLTKENVVISKTNDNYGYLVDCAENTGVSYSTFGDVNNW